MAGQGGHDVGECAAQGHGARVDQVELDLDAQGRPFVHDELEQAHADELPGALERRTTLCARSLAPMVSAPSSMSKCWEWSECRGRSSDATPNRSRHPGACLR